MRFALAALAVLPSTVLGAISIAGPSATSFWVQNTSNTITWSFTSGDPNPVDIVVINSDNTTLNGEFSIAQFVNTSSQTFTVTNVTLKSGSNYQVEFVNPQNHSDVFATSGIFDVKPPGTAPAPTSSVSNSSASATGSGSSSGSASPSNSSSPPAPTGGSSGASRVLGSTSVLSAIVACGVVSLAALL